MLAIDFLADEGWWAHNARNHAVFGQWILDDHNPPIFGAPLWTLAVRASYALFDVGLWQTRLPSALAGLATCALVYALVRRTAGWRPALAASVLLGLDPFSLAHHRSAFVESFMLAWLAASLVVLERAGERRLGAAAAGALFALAVLAKLWAIFAIAAFALYWLARLRSGRESGPRLDWREPLWFALGGAGVAAAVGLVFVLPHLDAVVRGVLVHEHRGRPRNPLLTVGELGMLVRTDGTLTGNGFVRGSGFVVFALALAVGRAWLVRASWPRERVALLCMAWLVAGLLPIAWQDYQPDRRWLGLVPPAVALLALAWARGGLVLPTRDEWRAAGRARRLAALAGVAAVTGLLVRWPLVPPLLRWLGTGAEPTLPQIAGASALGWAFCAAASAALLLLLARRLPSQAWPRLLPALLAFLCLLQLPLAALQIARAPTSVRDVSRALERATRAWPQEHKRMLGNPADTLAIETDLFAFLIRDRDTAARSMNVDGWTRFDPWIVIETEPDRPGFVRLPDLELVRDAQGNARRSLGIWVRAEAAEDVRRALTAPTAEATPR